MSTVTSIQDLPAEIRTALERKIESGALELPALPDVANRVISACFDPDCDIGRLVKIIQTDQFMSGHLMRLTNSALFSPATPITSLHHALSLLGLNQTRDVALRVSLENRVFQIKGFEQRARDLFEHALDTALLAQVLAGSLHIETNEAFLCGLMHDIGRPVLVQAIDDLRIRQGIKFRCKIELSEEVVAAAATEYHAEVGGQLIDHWNLPPQFAQVPRHHHNPDAAEDPSVLTRIVSLANDLAHLARSSGGRTSEMIRQHSQLEPLGVEPAALEDLLERLDEILIRKGD